VHRFTNLRAIVSVRRDRPRSSLPAGEPAVVESSQVTTCLSDDVLSDELFGACDGSRRCDACRWLDGRYDNDSCPAPAVSATSALRRDVRAVAAPTVAAIAVGEIRGREDEVATDGVDISGFAVRECLAVRVDDRVVAGRGRREARRMRLIQGPQWVTGGHRSRLMRCRVPVASVPSPGDVQPIDRDGQHRRNRGRAVCVDVA
jgi:hypothetical protein